MPELSVVIITRNEERNILRCLDSVRQLASDVVVVDSGSTDRTLEICSANGCRVYNRTFEGYGTQKQFAVDQAKNDWILSLDADEVVSDELRRELQRFTAVLETEEKDVFSGYYIPFMLHYLGRLVRYSGACRNLRLFNRKAGRFTLVPVHETVEIDGKIGAMKGRIIHYSYRDISHHFEKINFYSSRAAGGYHRAGKKYNRCWPAFKFPITFIVFYFIRRGFLDGYPGFMWAFLAGVYTTLKVAKTIELNEKG